MNLLMMLAASGSHIPNQVTQTFTASQSWTAPAGVTLLSSVVGRGADGAPGTAGEPAYDDPGTTTYYLDRYRQQYTWDGTNYNEDGNPELYTSSGPYSSPPDLPANYCDMARRPRYFCYAYFRSSITTPGAHHDAVPGASATTGAASTGFGFTFAGGIGGAASTSTQSNVAVTPGASYPLTIPAGGSITITYFQ